jgi:t-SNARE complex subunit (syntaxin)
MSKTTADVRFAMAMGPQICEIREAQRKILVHKFVAVMEHHRTIQETGRRRLAEMIERKRLVDFMGGVFGSESWAGGSTRSFGANEAPVDSPQPLQQNLVPCSAGLVTRRTAELAKLETSLIELQALFRNVALLIEEHGATIDSIATSVTSATEYVARSATTLKKAAWLKKKTLWRKIKLGGVVGVAATVAVLAIAL